MYQYGKPKEKVVARFFYKQHFYKQRQAEIGKKPRLNFCYTKIIYVHHPGYHTKITGHILKNKQNEIIRLIIMKIKMKMKTRSC